MYRNEFSFVQPWPFSTICYLFTPLSLLLMLAVRPPEYFPRVEYFALMAGVKKFVLADTFQYSRQSFQNRTKVRTPEGWTWMTVPLKGGQHGLPQQGTRIRTSVPWQRQHTRMLLYNYRTAPFWPHYASEVNGLIAQSWETLAALNVATIRLLHRSLGFQTPLILASEISGSPVSLAGICTAAGADGLVGWPDTADADRRGLLDYGLEVVERRIEIPRYHQNFAGFEPGMSALDLLMNYGPEAGPMVRAWGGEP